MMIESQMYPRGPAASRQWGDSRSIAWLGAVCLLAGCEGQIEGVAVPAPLNSSNFGGGLLLGALTEGPDATMGANGPKSASDVFGADSSTNSDSSGVPGTGGDATKSAAAQLAKAALRQQTKKFASQNTAQIHAYREITAEIAGVVPQSDDELFNAKLALAQAGFQKNAKSTPVASAVSALRAWSLDQVGQFDFALDSETGHIASAHGKLTPEFSGSPSAVFDAVAKSILPRISAACAMSQQSTWQLSKNDEIAGSGNRGAEYRRFECGVPVLYDYMNFAYGPVVGGEALSAGYFAKVHCSPELPANFGCTPTITAEAASAIAGAAFTSLEPTISVKNPLAIIHLADGPHLVYDSDVHKVSDDRRIMVDAHSGKVVVDEPARVHAGTYSGTLKLKVVQPYGSGLVDGAFGRAKVYLNDMKATLLGETAASGDYSLYSSSSDESWEVYFDGPWSRDGGSNLAAGTTDWTNPAQFAASSGTTYNFSSGSYTTVDQGRAEMFYELNYGRQLAETAWSGVQLFSPIKFQYSPTDNPNGQCCSGPNGYLYVGGYAASTRQHRWTVAHEFGHSPYFKVGGSLSCTQGGFGICSGWSEGSADFFSQVQNRLESLRSSAGGTSFGGCGENQSNASGTAAENDEFRPDDKFPEDACSMSDGHDTGNIFSALLLEWYYTMGWRDALARVLRMHAWINGTTVMSGDANSFYNHALAADNYFSGLSSGGLMHFPIADSWRAHDDSMAYNNLYDELPGAANPAFMVRPANGSSYRQIATGPGRGWPKSTGLDFHGDRDYVWLYTYAGERYEVHTSDLCGSVDPKLSTIRMQGGAEVIQSEYFDCNMSNNACFDEVSSVNDWLGIRVEQENTAGATGCYRLNVRTFDDVGDTETASRAIANNGTWYEGAWEAAGDVDYFRVYVDATGGGTDVYLDVETCEVASGENPDTVLDLYWQGSSAAVDHDDDDNHPGAQLGQCGDAAEYNQYNHASHLRYRISGTQPVGWYYIKVSEFANGTGRYKVRALQTAGAARDIGGNGRSDAFALSNDARTGRYIAGDLGGADVEDWFKVTLGEQEHVTFHTADGTLDTMLEVRGVAAGTAGANGYTTLATPSLQWMRKDDDGAFAFEATYKSSLHFCAPVAGDYYVRVGAYGANSGTYTLFMQRMGNFATPYPAFP